MKKFLAMLLAVAMVSVLVLGTAMAADVADNSGDANGSLQEGSDGTLWYCYNVAGAVDDVTAIASVVFTVSIDDLSSGCGGGAIINSEANGWDSTEWGNDGAEKPIVLAANGDNWDIILPVEAGDFTAEGSYNNAAIQHWWGGNIAIEGVTIKDADGNVLYTNLAEDTAADDTAADDTAADDTAAETTADETPAATDTTAKTADAMNVAMIAGLAVVALAGAVVVANKKNA